MKTDKSAEFQQKIRK